MVLSFGRNPTELRLIFTLDFIYQSYNRRLVMELIFLHPPYLQRWAGAENGAPLYNSLGFVDGTIARTCRPVLNKRVVYSRHTRGYMV